MPVEILSSGRPVENSACQTKQGENILPPIVIYIDESAILELRIQKERYLKGLAETRALSFAPFTRSASHEGGGPPCRPLPISCAIPVSLVPEPAPSDAEGSLFPSPLTPVCQITFTHFARRNLHNPKLFSVFIFFALSVSYLTKTRPTPPSLTAIPIAAILRRKLNTALGGSSYE